MIGVPNFEPNLLVTPYANGMTIPRKWVDHPTSNWLDHAILIAGIPTPEKIWKSDWIIIPTIGQNKKNVPNHPPEYVCSSTHLFLHTPHRYLKSPPSGPSGSFCERKITRKGRASLGPSLGPCPTKATKLDGWASEIRITSWIQLIGGKDLPYYSNRLERNHPFAGAGFVWICSKSTVGSISLYTCIHFAVSLFDDWRCPKHLSGSRWDGGMVGFRGWAA